ncbi:MAG: hypothetical protein IPG61_20280 [bacterium]|nr:hypothetical protein [bacterium]
MAAGWAAGVALAAGVLLAVAWALPPTLSPQPVRATASTITNNGEMKGSFFKEVSSVRSKRTAGAQASVRPSRTARK